MESTHVNGAVMLKVVVTGANGFVGKQLCALLLATPNLKLTQVTRQHNNPIDTINSDALSDKEMIEELSGYDCLIHLAARAHTKNSTECDFQRDNIELSKRLARIATSAKIKHFIFLSSIKVLGNSTELHAPFNNTSTPCPADTYGQSKWESELAIKKQLEGSATALIIVRPPLIWGANCKGNLHTLITVINKGIPIPFAKINNSRDIISLDNLCDFLLHIILHPKAENATFLVSDEKKRNVSDIIHLLESYTSKKAKLIKIPHLIFKVLKLHPRFSAKVSSFYDNLEVDITDTKNALNWAPKN